jgi:hypothetical protein
MLALRMKSRPPWSIAFGEFAPHDLHFLRRIDSKPNLLRPDAHNRHHDRVANLNPLASAPREHQHSPPPCIQAQESLYGKA